MVSSVVTCRNSLVPLCISWILPCRCQILQQADNIIEVYMRFNDTVCTGLSQASCKSGYNIHGRLNRSDGSTNKISIATTLSLRNNSLKLCNDQRDLCTKFLKVPAFNELKIEADFELNKVNAQLAANQSACRHPNKCTHRDANNWFFPVQHRLDRFIQCDEDGGCFVRKCPRDTEWNQAITTCDHARDHDNTTGDGSYTRVLDIQCSCDVKQRPDEIHPGLTSTSEEHGNEESNQATAGPLIGAVFGSLFVGFVLGAAALYLFIICKKKRSKNDSHLKDSEIDPMSNPQYMMSPGSPGSNPNNDVTKPTADGKPQVTNNDKLPMTSERRAKQTRSIFRAGQGSYEYIDINDVKQPSKHHPDDVKFGSNISNAQTGSVTSPVTSGDVSCEIMRDNSVYQGGVVEPRYTDDVRRTDDVTETLNIDSNSATDVDIYFSDNPVYESN